MLPKFYQQASSTKGYFCNILLRQHSKPRHAFSRANYYSTKPSSFSESNGNSPHTCPNFLRIRSTTFKGEAPINNLETITETNHSFQVQKRSSELDHNQSRSLNHQNSFIKSQQDHITAFSSSSSSSSSPSSSFSSPSPSSSSVVGTFYQRDLPPDLISFTSQAGRNLFRECLDLGTVENYFSLVGNFTTQSDPTFCGLGSLAMVLNALEVDPGRKWKGVWRWYSDEMLECCSTSLPMVRQRGITFDQFVKLARCHRLQAEAYRHDQRTLDRFKNDLYQSATEPGCHLVVSFSRPSMGQTGLGHFSPVGAYHPEKGLALILDVARFKYPSYWAPVDKLWMAMEPIDSDTNLSRGYIMLKSSNIMGNCRLDGCP